MSEEIKGNFFRILYSSRCDIGAELLVFEDGEISEKLGKYKTFYTHLGDFGEVYCLLQY